MNRDKSLDIARGLCIILVVVGHYIPESAPSWYVAINKAIYAFHMPAFMFISGYVYLLSLKKDSYVTFLAKKFKRLLIPYFVVSTIVISLKILSQSHMYVQNPVGFEAYLRMFYLPEAGYFLWFIFALWWMFVVIGLARTRKLRTALLCISIILYFLPVRFPDVFCLEQFRKMFVFFMSGVAIRDYFPMLLKKNTNGYCLVVCLRNDNHRDSIPKRYLHRTSRYTSCCICRNCRRDLHFTIGRKKIRQQMQMAVGNIVRLLYHLFATYYLHGRRKIHISHDEFYRRGWHLRNLHFGDLRHRRGFSPFIGYFSDSKTQIAQNFIRIQSLKFPSAEIP